MCATFSIRREAGKTIRKCDSLVPQIVNPETDTNVCAACGQSCGQMTLLSPAGEPHPGDMSSGQ